MLGVALPELLRWIGWSSQGLALWHLPVLIATTWIAYFDALKGHWVSDDWDGVANQTGQFKRINHPTKEQAAQAQTPHGGSTWNDLVTWIRWQIGKVPNPNYNKPVDPAKPDGPRHTQLYVASPLKHHRLSLILASACIAFAYTFLTTIVPPQVAFLACLLWAVHPVGAQCIAWISGIGYLQAALFMLIGLNYAVLLAPHPWMATWLGSVVILTGYGLIQWLAFKSQFTSLAAVVILAFLGLWPFAGVAALVFALGAYEVVKGIISVRAATFKAQQMGASTKVNPRKLVVVAKTLAYYTGLALWPKRLGLYHTFGYHYPLPWIEWEDRTFWAGVGLVGLASVAWWLLPGPATALHLGLVWWLAFLSFVLNWITVHQFVAERYVWLPVLGLCVIVATYAPVWLFWLLVGLALMRTWAHLPTYENELKFYQSNVWNHPTSEVAFGNLGVTYLRLKLAGSAADHWQVGANLNPDYDVNWYNLYSLFRGQGLLEQAKGYLLKALSCSTCHFPKQWRDEYNMLEMEIQWQKQVALVPVEQRLAWQHQTLQQIVADPKAPYPEFWKGKLKAVEAEVARVQQTTAVPMVVPSS